MKKVFLMVIAFIFITGSVWAQCPNPRPGCSTWNGDMNITGGDLTVDGDVTIDSGDNATEPALDVNHVFDEATDHPWGVTFGTVYNNEDFVYTPNAHGLKNFVTIKNSQGGTDTSTNTAVYTGSLTVKYNSASPITGTFDELGGFNSNYVFQDFNGAGHNVTITDGYGFRAQGFSGDVNASDTVTVPRYQGFWVEGNVSPSNMTPTSIYGVRVDKQVAATNNYGIWLNGDGAGANISYGTTNQLSTYRDATSGDFVVDSAGAAGLRIEIPTTQTLVPAALTIAADACGTLKRIDSTSVIRTNSANTFTTPAASNEGCIMTVKNVGTFPITLDAQSNFNSLFFEDIVLEANKSVVVSSSGAGGVWTIVGTDYHDGKVMFIDEIFAELDSAWTTAGTGTSVWTADGLGLGDAIEVSVAGATTATSGGSANEDANRYLIRIASEGSPDTYEVSSDGGVTYSEAINITGGADPVNGDVTITFSATDTATAGDLWSIAASGELANGWWKLEADTADNNSYRMNFNGIAPIHNGWQGIMEVRFYIDTLTDISLEMGFEEETPNDDYAKLYFDTDNDTTWKLKTLKAGAAGGDAGGENVSVTTGVHVGRIVFVGTGKMRAYIDGVAVETGNVLSNIPTVSLQPYVEVFTRDAGGAAKAVIIDSVKIWQSKRIN